MTRSFRILLAILSGVLLALPWIQGISGIISFIAFVPLLLIEDHIHKEKLANKFLAIFNYSFITFLVWNVIASYWIKNSDIIAAITVISMNSFVMSLIFGLFYITKSKFGNPLYIEGKIRTRSWDDKDGNKRYTTEIIGDNMQMLGSKQSNEESASAPESMPSADIENVPTEEDDLPF